MPKKNGTGGKGLGRSGWFGSLPCDVFYRRILENPGIVPAEFRDPEEEDWSPTVRAKRSVSAEPSCGPDIELLDLLEPGYLPEELEAVVQAGIRDRLGIP